MFRLFVSLYLFVVIALISLTAILDLVLLPKQQKQAPSLNTIGEYLLAVPEQRRYEVALSSGAIIKQYNASDILLPSAQDEQLTSQGYIILHDVELGAQLYINDNKAQLLAISFPQPEDINLYTYSILFFVLMGIALAIWTWPLWRDIRILEKTVRRVNRDGTLPSIPLPPNSNLSNIGSALSSLGQQVKELLQSQKELSGAVAHEFRTPIARLKFALAMLDDKNADIVGMQNDVNELEQLVQEMLDYATLDSINPGLSMAEIQLHSVCTKLIQKLHKSTEKNIAITINDEQELIIGDGHFIERAIQNVLGNALKYANSKVVLHITKTKDSIQIMIDDDGSGVAVSDRHRVFEPFFRPDGARSRDKGGAGLGLAIVAKIQKWHNGKCWVTSNQFGGARFILSYPKPRSRPKH